MKHIFILNPTSGRGSAKAIVPMIKEYFLNNEEEYEILETQYPGHAKELASMYHKEDDVCLYAVGGDGTLWEVVNGMHPEVTFSLIPSGTGNDFFRMMETNVYDMPKLLKDTIEGEELRIDYGICNGMRFVNMLCMGIDADVNARVNEVGKASIVPKKFLYVTSALKVIQKLNPLSFMLKADGKEEKKQGLLVAIMNGRNYGGGFTPTPDADFNDGVFDMCVVRPMKLSQLIPLLPKYFSGTHTKYTDLVEMSQVESVQLHFDQPVNVSLDGEMFQMMDIDAHIVKNGLSIKIPKGSYHEHRK